MGIDWITVSAQIVNFLLLVWLLKRFLYQPVLTAMAAREQRVTQGLKDAIEREQQAAATQQHYREQQREFEQQRDHALDKTKKQAEKIRKTLLDQARKDALLQTSTWQQQQQLEQQKWANAAQQELAQSVIDASRKVLLELSNQSLENAIINKFEQEFTQLNTKLNTQLKHQPERVMVTSTFPLDVKQQAQITKALQAAIENLPTPEFTTNTALLGGLEINIDEFRYAWNINHCIDELQDKLVQNSAIGMNNSATDG